MNINYKEGRAELWTEICSRWKSSERPKGSAGAGAHRARWEGLWGVQRMQTPLLPSTLLPGPERAGKAVEDIVFPAGQGFLDEDTATGGQ